MAFTRFCYKALNKIEIPIFGDGSQSRDFTFISDIVEANLLAAEHGGNGRVFNIGGGTNATVNDVLTILRKLTGELQVRYSEKMVGEAKKTAADTTAARRDLQFSPKVSLEQGIEAQVNWMKEILARGLSYPVS